MSGTPWATILGAVPLGGAAVVSAVPVARSQLAKVTGMGVSLVTLVLTAVMWTQFKTGVAGFQFTQSYMWIKQFGVHYSVGIDGVSLMLVALVAVLVPVVLLASWHESEVGHTSARTFVALVLTLEALLVGVFAATDVFLFYVFFEAMLIPMYFIIGSYGSAQRSYAAMKFLLYSLFGGLVMLAAIIGLYVVSAGQLAHGTFDITTLEHLHITSGVQDVLFLGFFVAFAIKAPLFPFHTWLPDAGAEAPTGGAVLLVGVLDKVGTFGFLRYCIPLFPQASRTFGPYVIALAIIGILYGALVAMAQRDLKRLVSYTSVAHFGFIAMGVFAFTSQGGSGAVLYMVNHGLSTGALFLVVGFLVARRQTRDIGEFGGVAKVTPLLAGAFLLTGLSSLALPGLNSFVSEFLVLVGTFTRYRLAAILATLGIVLSALYILLTYKRTMQGPITKEANLGLSDLSTRERFVIAPLLALVIILGVYPKPLLDRILPTVQATYQLAHQSDPVPSQPVAEPAPPTTPTTPTTGAHP
ncbi:MAG: NADH-quinone oxidoreductase subunit M [Mycobacteriales bacterium]